MSKNDTKDLTKFLKPFPPDVRERALWLRDFAWDLYPNANELIYDNYNAVSFGWSLTDRLGDLFCSVAVGRSSYNVHFGFYWGSKIADPEELLIGEGNQYRYVLVTNTAKFPKRYMKKLVKEAYAYSLGKMKKDAPVLKGATITKAIATTKRAPGKKTLPK